MTATKLLATFIKTGHVFPHGLQQKYGEAWVEPMRYLIELGAVAYVRSFKSDYYRVTRISKGYRALRPFTIGKCYRERMCSRKKYELDAQFIRLHADREDMWQKVEAAREGVA